MNYTNYDINSLVFMSGEADKWTVEQKREFLDTCPENRNFLARVEEVRKLQTAINDGVVKVGKMSSVNASSFKAWKSRNNVQYIFYGKMRDYYDGNGVYVYVDGEAVSVDTPWAIEQFFKRYVDPQNDKATLKRFEELAYIYRCAEKRHANDLKKRLYKIEHADAIEKSKGIMDFLRSFSVEVVVDGNLWEISNGLRYGNYGTIKSYRTGEELTPAELDAVNNALVEVNKEIAQIIAEHSVFLSHITQVSKIS